MAVLKFQIERQGRDQWCWAAVAASICGFYQDEAVPTQCGLANQFLFPGEDCCQATASDNCNIPFALDLVLNQLGHLVQPPQGVVSFEDLNHEITGNSQPVAVRIMFSDLVTAHFVVVIGCAIDDRGTQVLKIADPSEVAGNVTSIGYSALMNDYRPGATWDQTYFTAKKA
jgi:hypothetical protein